MRRFSLLLLLLLPSGCGFLGHQFRHLAGSPEARLADDVVIERDEWGVPHVHGRSDAAVLFGLAYAMAEDNYWQIEEDYLLHLGWAAHYYGEHLLAGDLVRAALGVEEAARAAHADQPPELQELWQAFAQGLNHYIRVHPDERRLIVHYEPWMLFARALGTLHLHEAVDGLPLSELATRAGWAVTTPPPTIEVTAATRAGLVTAEAADSGRARLLAVVAAPFFGPGQVYEAALSTADGWRFTGVARLGLPHFLAGHNDAAAWLVSDSGPRLRAHVVPRQAVQTVDDSVRVNTAEGVVLRRLRLQRAPEGPVLALTDDSARVVLWTPHEPLSQSWQLMKATSPATFRAALTRAAGAAYADTSGATLHLGELTLTTVEGTASAAALVRAAFHPAPQDAGPEIDALIDEWERIGGTNPQRAFPLDSIMEQLRNWRQQPDAASPTATLLRLWQDELRADDYRQGFGRFRALETVVARMQRELGSTNVAWSELNRLQRRHTSGAQAFADTLPSLPVRFPLHTRRGPGPRRYGVSGVAWIGLFEMSSPPRLHSIVPFGQSADSASSHWFDQAPHYAGEALKQRGGVRERYHPGRRSRETGVRQGS